MSDILLDPDSAAHPPVTHVDALPVGTRLGEFEIQGLLGVGGFGMVYRAYDHSLHRTVAIKEYMPSALAGRTDGITVSLRSSMDQATYQAGLQSFVGEARLLAQFDHPSLVKVYRFWEANNTAYMVMPLYVGMTLKQARSLMSAPPPEAWLRTVLWSILHALQVLHEHHTLHRDVSPDNIFLQNLGPPVLLDLGAARRALREKSHKMTAILKVNYAPIEQYADADDLAQGAWTDLYALAAVVYDCLRNAPPLPATVRVVRDSMPPLQSVAQTVQEHFGLAYSEAFVQAVAHALVIQPEERTQSVHDFIEEMALEAPPGLARFDWRARLGAGLQPAQQASAQSDLRTAPQARQSESTQARDRTKTLGARTSAAASDSLQKSLSGLSMRRKIRVLIGLPLVLVVFLAVVAGVWLGEWLDETRLVEAPAQATMPAPAAPPADELADPALLGTESAQTASGLDAQGPGSGPGVTMPLALEGTPSAQSAASAGVAAPAGAVRPPSSAAPKPVPKPAPRPAPKPTVRKVEPLPAPAPSRSPVARKPLCEDANFLLKPMCIHLECQKADNAQLPVCIEERKRYPDGPR